MAIFGLKDGTATAAEIAAHPKRQGDLTQQTVTTLASILTTLQSEQFNMQREADLKIVGLMPATLSNQQKIARYGAQGLVAP